MSDTKSGGCLSSLTRQTAIIIIAVILSALTFVNVYSAGIAVEDSCEQIHPLLFQIQISADVRDPRLPNYVNVIDEDYVKKTNQERDARESGINLAAQGLPSDTCLQTYGRSDPGQDGAFTLDQDGMTEFAAWYNEIYGIDEYGYIDTPPSEEDNQVISVVPEVQLSNFGKNWLYFILPAYVILLPIITIALIRSLDSKFWWYVMISLVAALAMTSALVYIELADVSGLNTLTDFGTGIFGGTITGTALAFMGKLIE